MDIKAVAIVLGFVLLVVLFVMNKKKRESLLAEQKIVERPKDFAEYTEEFTLRPVSMQEVEKTIQSSAVLQENGCEIQTDDSRILFKNANYKAVLVCTEKNEEKSVWEFAFVEWSTYEYSTNTIIRWLESNKDMEMNALLTGIEKMFLNFDSEAKVKKVKSDITSKRKFYYY